MGGYVKVSIALFPLANGLLPHSPEWNRRNVSVSEDLSGDSPLSSRLYFLVSN